jgi:hypothetical protein
MEGALLVKRSPQPIVVVIDIMSGADLLGILLLLAVFVFAPMLWALL